MTLSIRCISIFIFSILLIIGLILFSIYFSRQDSNSVVKISRIFLLIVCFIVTLFLIASPTSTMTSTGMNTTIISTSSTTKSESFFLNDFQNASCFFIIVPVCQLRFQAISIITPYPGFSYYKSPIVDDFNNDGLLDIAFFSSLDYSIYISFGYGNGTFGMFSAFLVGYVGRFGSMTVADFNGDNRFDIALTDSYLGCVNILLGNIDGTFENTRTLCMGPDSYLETINTADFNGDTYIDIAVVNTFGDNIAVFLGNGDGNFSMQTILYTGNETYSNSIAITDFNGDAYLDIAVANALDRNIGIFLGHGDGTFDVQKTFFTGGGINPMYIAVGDFNNDTYQDVVFSYNGKRVGIMFGYGNGNFSEKRKFNIESALPGCPIAVVDLNRDGYLDIVVAQMFLYSVSILIGDGKGNFNVQTIFSTELRNTFTEIAIGDINNDGYQDVIALDTDSGSLDLILNTGIC